MEAPGYRSSLADVQPFLEASHWPGAREDAIQSPARTTLFQFLVFGRPADSVHPSEPSGYYLELILFPEESRPGFVQQGSETNGQISPMENGPPMLR